MQDKWFVVINPTAGRGLAGRKWPAIQSAMASHRIAHEFCISTDPAHARDAIRAAHNTGYRRFVSVGGDGSHHTLINALDPWFADSGQSTVGMIPVGTGNDWARTHGIRSNIPRAVDNLRNRHTIRHAVGKVSSTRPDGFSRLFVNVLGTCLDGHVVHRLTQGGDNSLGALQYLYHGVRGLFGYKPPLLSISGDGHTWEGRVLTAHVGICRFSGGGMSFTPHAQPSGNKLAVTYIQKSSRLALIGNIYRLYAGTIGGYRHVVTFSASNVMIAGSGSKNMPVEADGEFLGFGEIRVEIQPNAFKLIIPSAAR